ncbi:unnamed protein product, partial [Arabidopsis halleri]
MYSLDGISVIASAIGEPLHTEKSKLDPFHFGDTKVKVEICLDSSPPSVIVVKDAQGNSVRVNVAYPRLPPKCCNCEKFGHLLNRCPKPLMRKPLVKGNAKLFVAAGVAVKDTKISLAPVVKNKVSAQLVAAIKSLPQIPVRIGVSSAGFQSSTRASRSRSRSRGRGRSAPRVVCLNLDNVVVPEYAQVKGVAQEENSLSSVKKVSAKVDKGSHSGLVIRESEDPNLPDEDGFVKVRSKGRKNLAPSNSHTVRYVAKVVANRKAGQGHPSYSSSSAAGKRKSEPFVDSSSKTTQGKGMNNQSRQRVIRSWVGANKPLFGSVLETHVSEENASAILVSTFPGWRWETNYSHSAGGRIWVVWDPSISVICFYKSAQLVFCGVHDPATNQSFSVGFVYAFNTVIQRRSLWDEVKSISQDSPARSNPCIFLGDFNQIVSADEHFSIIPHNLPIGGMSEFHSCLSDNDFTDLASKGVFFTWSNGQPDDPVLRKLDRAVVNEDWCSLFPDSVAIFDPPGDSDHSPCLVNTDASVERSKKSFKYFSFLSTHSKFKDFMSEAWSKEVCVGSKLFVLGQRMREIKYACRRLNRIGFGNIQQRTRESLAHLESVQSSLLTNPSPSLFREEFVARQKWNFFASALEVFYKRKSRIRWYSEGDANTAFFHRAVLANHAKNCIKFLRGADGTRIENQNQIKDMTIAYFQNLLGTESVGVSPLSIDEIKDLTNFRCSQSLASQLLAIPSDIEIKDTLFKMPRNKAPGPDGFPVEFYLEAWEVVGQDTVSAVKEFFSSGYLPRRFNATAIALIPKVLTADSLSQFIPVSCCTTLYKVIARILKKRLKLFISDAVQENQVGFVK